MRIKGTYTDGPYAVVEVSHEELGDFRFGLEIGKLSLEDAFAALIAKAEYTLEKRGEVDEEMLEYLRELARTSIVALPT